MILQALCDYYQRKANDPESGIAPEGFEIKRISFLIEYDANGEFSELIDVRESQDKKKIGFPYQVPSLPIGTKRVGTKIVPNLLWDSCDYALGISQQNDSEAKSNSSKLDSFINEIKEFNKNLNNDKLNALVHFLQNDPIKSITNTRHKEALEDLLKSEKNIVGFTFKDDNLIPITTILSKEIQLYRSLDEKKSLTNKVCLVTGEKTETARLHNSIPQWGGGMSSLVSFQKKSGYDSYGHEQADNAPVSNKIVSDYVKALDLLLNKQDYSHYTIGNTTFCFWAQKDDDILEHNFMNLFWSAQDNPDRNVLEIKQLFASVKKGQKKINLENKFFILGLAPLSKGRAAVRLWMAESYKDLIEKINRYFEDIAIDSEDGVHPFNWYLRTLVLESGTPQKRDIEKNLPPNLPGDLMRAILSGIPFPYRILNLALNRIKAECARDKDEKSRDKKAHIDACRTALLKAYLNRKQRFYKTTDKEITMSLDTTNKNTGYLLGRLFATLEKLQEEAQGSNLNSTIKDRYYGAASSTPCTVFPQLFKLKNFHLAKLSNPGRKTNFEKLIGEITDGIPAEGVPAHLSLDDQARFAIGYYHQRQDLFKSKEEK